LAEDAAAHAIKLSPTQERLCFYKNLKIFNKFLSAQAGWREYLLSALTVLNLVVWFAVYERRPTEILTVYFLDVGQGDAIFIDSPTHKQVLVDGGPDRKVLSELSKIMPFGDKSIDVVVATHPDADHITGLIDVMRRYEVGVFIEPGVESQNNLDDMLAAEAAQISQTLARRGMSIDLGSGARLLVLFPNEDVSNWETNEASIVAKLVYGGKSFLLTGDTSKNSEYKMMALGENILNADVLKAGHHGSDTSTSILFANAVSPEYSVISAGKSNRYGHPHKSVLEILNKAGSKIVSTAELGTIKFETDGETLILK
jgi:competence protein ComEC